MYFAQQVAVLVGHDFSLEAADPLNGFINLHHAGNWVSSRGWPSSLTENALP
jgi:hypothetical protein